MVEVGEVGVREVGSNKREHYDRAPHFAGDVLDLNQALPAAFVLADDQDLKKIPLPDTSRLLTPHKTSRSGAARHFCKPLFAGLKWRRKVPCLLAGIDMSHLGSFDFELKAAYPCVGVAEL